MANKRLNATITIGGAITDTLRNAFGTATKSLTQLDMLIAVILAVSLHFMMGLGGMVSFGHAAYFGLGDSINYLDDNTKSTGAGIIDYLTRVGGVGDLQRQIVVAPAGHGR